MDFSGIGFLSQVNSLGLDSSVSWLTGVDRAMKCTTQELIYDIYITGGEENESTSWSKIQLDSQKQYYNT
jgi:hypothetical protein